MTSASPALLPSSRERSVVRAEEVVDACCLWSAESDPPPDVLLVWVDVCVELTLASLLLVGREPSFDSVLRMISRSIAFDSSLRFATDDDVTLDDAGRSKTFDSLPLLADDCARREALRMPSVKRSWQLSHSVTLMTCTVVFSSLEWRDSLSAATRDDT